MLYSARVGARMRRRNRRSRMWPAPAMHIGVAALLSRVIRLQIDYFAREGGGPAAAKLGCSPYPDEITPALDGEREAGGIASTSLCCGRYRRR